MLVETSEAIVRQTKEMKPSQRESRIAILLDEYGYRFFWKNGLVCV